MLPADMVGGVSATRAANLEASGEALDTFVKRVDNVLKTLEGSAGNPAKIGAQTINAASLTSGGRDIFPEAHGLYDQYKRVHGELTRLSRNLHLQIEAIGIAVQGARVGFDNLEEEQRQRFWAIQAQVGKDHAAANDKSHTGNDAQSGAGL
ncbi:hypothetical protein [Streptomyces sp. NBC_00557]|uniref:hypothetical protein n=1 Tax=Streptomyces sp. NBC_00557 TaxID=2975776 RepID=UPI002E80DF4D|nr:hypothetical protein [Streptomyces sp. NBC_00557]WUC34385.1 hypothetical protein OG956_09275 [Streptomyces sp. NBC_00557]